MYTKLYQIIKEFKKIISDIEETNKRIRMKERETNKRITLKEIKLKFNKK